MAEKGYSSAIGITRKRKWWRVVMEDDRVFMIPADHIPEHPTDYSVTNEIGEPEAIVDSMQSITGYGVGPLAHIEAYEDWKVFETLGAAHQRMSELDDSICVLCLKEHSHSVWDTRPWNVCATCAGSFTIAEQAHSREEVLKKHTAMELVQLLPHILPEVHQEINPSVLAHILTTRLDNLKE